MTSPYTPEFEHTDWPPAALFGHVPEGNSPNQVLHRVEAEFGNVADGFTELAAADGALDTRLDALDARLAGIREAINALLAGRLPTTPDLPVSPGVGEDNSNRAILLDGAGGLVVFWTSRRVNNTFQVYGSRLDLARPGDGFSPAVTISGGSSGASGESAVLLPNGDLIVTYSRSPGGAVMKRAATLAGLAAASETQVSAAASGSAGVVLAGGQVVFLVTGTSTNKRWAFRRYDPAARTFVDSTPLPFGPATHPPREPGPLHASVFGRFVWLAYYGTDTEDQRFADVERLDAANGSLVSGGGLPDLMSTQYVQAVSETEALVFYNASNGIRMVSAKANGSPSSTTVPGTDGWDYLPAAVRDTDGTISLCYIRSFTPTDAAVMVTRRSPRGDWGPRHRVNLRALSSGVPQPVLVPGQGLWLVYGSHRTGDVDLYATRIITEI